MQSQEVNYIFLLKLISVTSNLQIERHTEINKSRIKTFNLDF